MRVIGVDPGSACTGFGVVESGGDGPRHIFAGTIRAHAGALAQSRLRNIHERLLAVIDLYRPDALSLERSFVADNVRSAFRLGEARAMALLAAAERNLPLFEYAPNEVKLAVAAYGHADKSQVKFMVRRTLGLDENAELADDAADGLALAICHLIHARIPHALRPVAARCSTALRKAGVRR